MDTKQLTRVDGKKVRYWVAGNVPAGVALGRTLINPGGQSPLPGAVGNIVGGNVPYPMLVTSVRCQYTPDGVAIQQFNQWQIAQFIGSARVEIMKANQVTVFEWSWSDCQRLQLVLPGSGSQTTAVIDLSSREKNLAGDKQRFNQGDVCSVYVNFETSFSYSGAILVELNGYAV